MLRTIQLAAALALVACGGDSNNSKVDASGAQHDAPHTTIVSMSCVGITPAGTVTIPSGAYSPTNTTINQGQVVLFMTTTEHDVSPGHTLADSAITDPGLHVGFNQTGCLMFTQTGDFGFHCSNHLFNGTITVQ
jgi:plastocyanin